MSYLFVAVLGNANPVLAQQAANAASVFGAFGERVLYAGAFHGVQTSDTDRQQ